MSSVAACKMKKGAVQVEHVLAAYRNNIRRIEADMHEHLAEGHRLSGIDLLKPCLLFARWGFLSHCLWSGLRGSSGGHRALSYQPTRVPIFLKKIIFC